jgi:hypothetical protein
MPPLWFDKSALRAPAGAFSVPYTSAEVSYDLTKLQQLSKIRPAVVSDRMQALRSASPLHPPCSAEVDCSRVSCRVTCQVAQLDYVYTFSVCGTTAPPANCLKADGTSRVDPYWAPAWQTNATETPVPCSLARPARAPSRKPDHQLMPRVVSVSGLIRRAAMAGDGSRCGG